MYVATLPKWQEGLIVNCLFKEGPFAFERLPDRHLFEVLDIPLLHGWIPDEDDPFIQGLSYDRAQELVAFCESTSISAGNVLQASIEGATMPLHGDLQDQAARVRNFFKTTPTQLSARGMAYLRDSLG